jgi:hypothetical protein
MVDVSLDCCVARWCHCRYVTVSCDKNRQCHRFYVRRCLAAVFDENIKTFLAVNLHLYVIYAI